MKVNLHDKLVHIHAMKHLVMYALLSCLSVSYATAAEVLIDGITYGRFYKFNLSLANSQNLIKATANVILLSQI